MRSRRLYGRSSLRSTPDWKLRRLDAVRGLAGGVAADAESHGSIVAIAASATGDDTSYKRIGSMEPSSANSSNSSNTRFEDSHTSSHTASDASTRSGSQYSPISL